MSNLIFVLSLSVLLTAILAWGFKNLTGERWQFLAAVPVAKRNPEEWNGLNLTTYGLVNAGAYLFSAAIFFVLLGAISVPLPSVYALVLLVLFVAMPASRIIARVVEKKAYTFTVGGASFAGLLAAPVVVLAINEVSGPGGPTAIPMLPALATLSIAYSFGEGLGRLACISFGCCYGKPWSEAHPLLRKLFMNRSFTFFGKTKKIAYESGLDGEKVVPIQAVTSVIYVSVGLVGTMGYLASSYEWAFLFTVAATQGWRAISEIFRSDYRGGRKVSAYQKMAILAVFLAFAIVFLLPAGPTPTSKPDVMSGLSSIWNPGILLSLQALGLLVFTYMGRSRVTGSTLSFHVHQEHI
jgi:hypothetical protein